MFLYICPWIFNIVFYNYYFANTSFFQFQGMNQSIASVFRKKFLCVTAYSFLLATSPPGKTSRKEKLTKLPPFTQILDTLAAAFHCVKSVCIPSYYGPHFPAFGLNTERFNSQEMKVQVNRALKRYSFVVTIKTIKKQTGSANKFLSIPNTNWRRQLNLVSKSMPSHSVVPSFSKNISTSRSGST